MPKKTRYSYTDEFKAQIVEMNNNGKSSGDIAKEYGIAKSTVSLWSRNHKKSGKFKSSENLSPLEIEVRELRKENKRLEMEVDLLKQVALIMGRK